MPRSPRDAPVEQEPEYPQPAISARVGVGGQVPPRLTDTRSVTSLIHAQCAKSRRYLRLLTESVLQIRLTPPLRGVRITYLVLPGWVCDPG